MQKTLFFTAAAVAAVAATFAFGAAAAADNDDGAARRGTPGVLLELFTSQGCYSCPPADELLRQAYTGQEDLIPLEFHVDYWDDLIYGFAGSWKDPFSSPDYTRRQRDYNVSLRGKPSMYTPQIIVQGRHETVGSRRGAIEEFIAEERGQTQPLEFFFSGSADSGWEVDVRGALRGTEELFYAIYIRDRVTEVTAGENKDKRMRNSHIVREIKRARNRRYAGIPAHDAAEEGCAVWVQRPQSGAVIAAAKCPGG